MRWLRERRRLKFVADLRAQQSRDFKYDPRLPRSYGAPGVTGAGGVPFSAGQAFAYGSSGAPEGGGGNTGGAGGGPSGGSSVGGGADVAGGSLGTFGGPTGIVIGPEGGYYGGEAAAAGGAALSAAAGGGGRTVGGVSAGPALGPIEQLIAIRNQNVANAVQRATPAILAAIQALQGGATFVPGKGLVPVQRVAPPPPPPPIVTPPPPVTIPPIVSQPPPIVPPVSIPPIATQPSGGISGFPSPTPPPPSGQPVLSLPGGGSPPVVVNPPGTPIPIQQPGAGPATPPILAHLPPIDLTHIVAQPNTQAGSLTQRIREQLANVIPSVKELVETPERTAFRTAIDSSQFVSREVSNATQHALQIPREIGQTIARQIVQQPQQQQFQPQQPEYQIPRQVTPEVVAQPQQGTNPCPPELEQLSRALWDCQPFLDALKEKLTVTQQPGRPPTLAIKEPVCLCCDSEEDLKIYAATGGVNGNCTQVRGATMEQLNG